MGAAEQGLRADWPHPEVGYRHKLVLSPTDHDRMYQQNHVGMHRSDDAAQSWVEITEGLPTEFGFAAAVHPHDRDSFYVIPLDPGHTGHARRRGCGVAHARRGLRGSDSTAACRSTARTSVCSARRWRSTRSTRPASTSASTGQVFASADEGDSWNEIASYLPGITSVEVAQVA